MVNPRFAIFFLTSACLLAEGTQQDPKAVEIAQSVMRAMGGQDAWNATHYLRFDFKVSIGGETKADRNHLLGKQTGRYPPHKKNKEVLLDPAYKHRARFLHRQKIE